MGGDSFAVKTLSVSCVLTAAPLVVVVVVAFFVVVVNAVDFVVLFLL